MQAEHDRVRSEFLDRTVEGHDTRINDSSDLSLT